MSELGTDIGIGDVPHTDAEAPISELSLRAPDTADRAAARLSESVERTREKVEMLTARYEETAARLVQAEEEIQTRDATIVKLEASLIDRDAEIAIQKTTITVTNTRAETLKLDRQRLYSGFTRLLSEVEDATGVQLSIDARLEASLLASEVGIDDESPANVMPDRVQHAINAI